VTRANVDVSGLADRLLFQLCNMQARWDADVGNLGVGGGVAEGLAADEGAPASTRPAHPSDRAVFLVLAADGSVELQSPESRPLLAQPLVLESLRAALRFFAATDRSRMTMSSGRFEIYLARLAGADGERYAATLVESSATTDPSALTPAQRHVASFAIAGATVPEIARHLGRSRETVRTHLREIYRRLDVSNRVELARALEPRR
jgi:DNA-binding CsgD family transcriptional regulator